MLGSKPLALELPGSFPRLSRPPVVEATVVLSARPQRWDASLCGELAEAVAKRGFEVTDTPPDCSDLQEGEADAPSLLAGTRDPRLVLRFGPQGMQLSHLAPYTDWGTLKTHLLATWAPFATLAAPVSIDRVEVRFVNRVYFDDLAELQRACPAACAIPDALLPAARCHTSATELAVQEAEYSLRVLLDVRAEDERLRLLLMPEAGCSAQLPADDVEQLERVLERMRYLKNKAFFTWFSRQAIEQFAVEKP